MTLPVSFPPIVAAPDGAWHRAVLNWFEPAAPLLEGTPGTPPCASGAFWVPLLSPEPRRIELLARALRQVEIGEGSRWPVLRRARERWGPDAAAAFEAAAAALARLVAALSDAAGRGHSVPDELVDAARGGPGGADPARWSADGWDQAAWDRAVAAAHVGFQLLYLFFFDRVEHELFRGRSRLSHTELGHTVGDLFEPDRVAWTVSVLRGTAPPDRYQGIRQLLGEWPLVREAVRRNARAIVEDFDPVAPACRRLGPLPADRTWLADLGRVWMRRGLGLGQWGSKVERALDDLDAALDQMRRGELAAEDLPRRFHDLIGIYSGNGYFNLRGGL